MLKRLLGLVMAALLSAPALALDASAVLGGAFSSESRSDRAAIARDLHAQVKKLLAYLPTPKPQDVLWVNTELAARERLWREGQIEAGNARSHQLHLSVEFAHIRLYNSLSAISDSLACAASASVSIGREMKCWATAAHLLTDQHSLEASIERSLESGRLAKEAINSGLLNELNRGFHGMKMLEYGRGIQQYIVIPYLERQAK